MVDSIRQAQLYAETLLGISEEIGQGRGTSGHASQFVPICNSLCTKAGIKLPHLRVVRGIEELGNYAIPQKNTLIFNDEFTELSPSMLDGLVAHKLGHLVMGHTRSTPEVEIEADKFSQMLLMPSSLKAWKDYQHIKLEMVEEARGKEWKIVRWMRQGKSKLENDYAPMYGALQERIDAMERPLAAEEKTNFERHIKRYNERSAVEVEPVIHRDAKHELALKLERARAAHSVSNGKG